MQRTRLLLGVSVFWLALSILSDGINSLVLPAYLLSLAPEGNIATTLGLLSFVGLAAGMLVQPIAGQWSDRIRDRHGRHLVVGAGVALSIGALFGFGLAGSVVSVLAAYLLLQVAAAVAQAGQQGYIPDLVPPSGRGLAAGFKGLMDVGGATVGFLLLGGLLSGGSIAPALFAVGASLLGTYLLAVILVREPRLEPAAAPRPGLAGAFRLDLRRHGAFERVVASRFLFLLGTFAVGRFLLLFVADRLRLDPAQAAEEAGMLLAALTLVTALAAPLGGWAADRLGRVPLMLAGAALSAVGVLGLIGANSPLSILLYGAVMSLGSAAFASANWALTTELIPPGEAARFMGLANFGTAGGAAAAGLLGPLVDWGNGMADGRGFTFLLVAAALAFAASTLPLYRLRERRAELPFPMEGAEHERA